MSKAKKFFAEAAMSAAEKAQLEEQALRDAELQKEEQARKEFALRLQADPFNTLDVLLILALTEHYHGKIGMTGKPKQFLNKVWELKDKVKVAVVKTILDPLYKAPFPFKMLTDMANNYVDLEQSTAEFIAAGHHGMLIHDKVIYPIQLFAEDQDAVKWGYQNEHQLMRMAAHVACTMFKLDAIQCHVMFFVNHHFSHRMASVAHRVVDIKAAYPDQDEANIVPLIKVVA